MRVLGRDMKVGAIKLLLQNLDDLWHLYNLVEPGDLVRATTYRREESRTDKIRPERREKVRLEMGLRVERVEFHEFADRLRILGVIEEGTMDLGSHHTLNVGDGDSLWVVKEWRDSHLKRIEEAVEASEQPVVTILSLDDEAALLAQMHQYGIREVAEIKAEGGGKLYGREPSKADYFTQVLQKLRQLDPSPGFVVLGPGFTREDFLQFAKEREPELFREVQSYGTAHPGMTGIQEAMKSGLAAKVLQDSRVAKETKLVEDLLQEIGKEGLYAYGPEEVKTAVEAGAVETLLVTDEASRTLDVEDLMRKVEERRGKVTVVSTHHDAGRKLKSFGGLGALLRFRIG